jgi:hypothetical protein
VSFDSPQVQVGGGCSQCLGSLHAWRGHEHCLLRGVRVGSRVLLLLLLQLLRLLLHVGRLLGVELLGRLHVGLLQHLWRVRVLLRLPIWLLLRVDGLGVG